MFDAIVARKARLNSVIDGAGKQPREDLVTSALFGPLKFLLPDARAKALQVLCGYEFGADVQISLWPFFKSDSESAEPDVVLEFTNSGRRNYWIVEVKWGAALGKDQAGREIRTVQSGYCRRGQVTEGKRNVIGYSLLGAERKHEKALNALRLSVGQMHVINDWSWKEMCDRLRQLADTSSDAGLIAWAKLAADFLSGEPQGTVLGSWPEMELPGEYHFYFDLDEDFALQALPAVLPTMYSFREAND
ncbi:hypothetical protein [Epibacterium ulvae]|uniref:hypothetical protein n=1 Tax=Epibacterium ulvae TaxID=1156985 RepID=UPI0024937EB4|nr:hypothetical protein [Epibacterium ulvae]